MTVATIGEGPGKTYAGQNDCNLNESIPTVNGNSSGVFVTQSPSAGNRRHGLFIVSGLSNIPAASTVSAATLTLRTGGVSASCNVSVYKIIRTWDATQATWNSRSSGVSWASNGGLNATDVDMTPIATLALTTTADATVTISNAAFVSLVEGWVNGTISNYGLLFAYDPDTAYDGKTAQFRGGSDGAPSLRPELSVTYTAIVVPTVSTNPDVSVVEGSNAVHTVTLTSTTVSSIPLTATLAGSGANPATGGGTDFVSDLSSVTYSNGVTHSGGTLTVPSGVASFTVTIPTTGNALDENDETYTLTVGGVASVGTITDDDAPPTVSISDATESFGVVTHTLTLSQASGKTITVQVDSANGSKTAGTHYTAITAQTVTFNPGETEQTVTVTVL